VDDYRLHRDIFFQELTSYVTPALTSDDLVLFHTIQLSELEAIWTWYANLQKKRPKLAIILRFDIYAGFSGRVMPEKSQEFYSYYIKQLHQVSPTGVRFFTDTRAMAEQYSQTVVHFELIPIPLNLSPEKSVHCKDQSIHLVFLGDAFAHKGFGLVVEAIPQVLAENPNIHFTIQVSNASRSYEILKEFQQVTLIDQRPSEEEYYQIMSSATALLLPYDPASYRFQSSHIFIESILRGIPVICSENGSMFPDLVNCGMLDLVFSPYDTQAMVNKILQFSSLQSFFSNKFIKHTKDLVDFHTSENFIRVLTSTTKTSTPLAASSIHFFTIVLNGEPFIRHHIDSLKHLPFKWHWHIVEGVAELNHDTAWSLQHGGRIVDELHKDGLSNDGTTEYLDQLVQQYPINITIYRKPSGQFWDGKLEMVNAPLGNITEKCLLWQIDVDEFWRADQLMAARQLFLDQPDRTAAFYWCHFFVGPDKVVSTRNCYSQNPAQEWLRTWSFRPGMRWGAHEPPILVENDGSGGARNVAAVNPFRHHETEAAGLIFQHFAYALEKQLAFKETYYGYRDAIAGWRRLQGQTKFPVLLRDFFRWVQDDTQVDTAEHRGISPLAVVGYAKDKTAATAIRPLVLIDGIFFQFRMTGIARVWVHLLTEWSKTDFMSRILVLDRAGTAPKIPGVRYREIPLFDMMTMENDRVMLQQVCDEERATLFCSTYYTTPVTTPSIFMVYDMIPENTPFFNLDYPIWQLKHYGIRHASAYMAISRSTAHDLIQFHPQADGKVTIAHCAVDRTRFFPSEQSEIETFRQHYGIHTPYLLFIGDRTGYKNAGLLFHTLGQMQDKGTLEVVCVGGNRTLETEFTEVAAGFKVHVLALSDAELRVAYSGALAFAYPSVYEGFGLPILEAMACGCPVITCHNTSIPEVAGAAALYVKEYSIDEMLDAIQKMRQPEIRQGLIQMGFRQVQRFSWERMAETVKSVLLKVQGEICG
jgi:glycosyltransferase involved in cell wall biosynthesis